MHAQDGRQLAFYSDSNIKVKFCEDPPSSQPCPFFLQRTGQRLFLALTDGLPPMHSTLLCWGIRIKTENQFFTSSHSLSISCAVSVQTIANKLLQGGNVLRICVTLVSQNPPVLLPQKSVCQPLSARTADGEASPFPASAGSKGITH